MKLPWVCALLVLLPPPAGHCPIPAVPPGAQATTTRYRLGDQISFQCQEGLGLVGSAQRICTPQGEWSGAEPSCRAPYSLDRAEDVRNQFESSFTNVLSLVASSGSSLPGSSQPSFGRTIILSDDSFLDLYLLVDASHSVTQPIFNDFKKCVEIIIERIASFDVAVRFAVLSYATDPKSIVNIYDEEAIFADDVIARLTTDMKYQDHGNRTGTNIHGALTLVFEMMSFQAASLEQQQKMGDWEKTRHVIILFTDVKSNVGGSPNLAVARIEEFLNVNPDRKDYLDIYTFGIKGLEVDWEAMNEIASKKPGETHAFILEDSKALKKVFEDVLVVQGLDDLCGLANRSLSASLEQQSPWHAAISMGMGLSCRGSLVSRSWVLTAAHCFNERQNMLPWRIKLGDGAEFQIKRRIDHELYNVRGKLDRGIREFYDYDISLLELDRPATVSGTVRPICLPCTDGANKALKKPPASTCKDHELELLGMDAVPALFVSLEGNQMEVFVKTQKRLKSCISGAVQPNMVYSNVTDVSEVVTERFLCSGRENGGSNEAATCKGESGGSLFVERRHRFIQVGVVSWGTYDPCEKKRQDPYTKRLHRDRAPWGHRPRDFYISLFGVQGWLRKHLGGALRFLPEN
uniref:Complement C2 n=1 Tax=Sphenodon punctatus TaxID=8508 RepID=A0A8D0HAA2_SPHPU